MTGNSEWIALAVVFGMTIAAMSLIAIWASFSQRPWHHRAIVLLAVLALFLPPGMYEPLLFFAMQWLMTIGLLLCVRRLRIARAPSDEPSRRLTRPKFHLSDLCWLVTLSAVGIAIFAFAVKRSDSFPWNNGLGPAIITAMIAVTASVAVLLRWRIPWRIGILVLFFATASLGVMWSQPVTRLGGVLYKFFWFDLTTGNAYTAMCVIDAGLVLLALVAWKGTQRPITVERSRGRNVWHNLPTFLSWGFLAASILPSVALLSWLYWQIAVLPPIPETVRDPRPNRFAELVTLASQLENVNVPYIDWDGPEAVASFASKYESLLGDARVLLRDRCHEELNWPPDSDAFEKRRERITKTRQLVRAYAVSGAHAANGQRFDVAWKEYGAIFDLTHAYAQGGVLIDVLIGLSTEDMGMYGCRSMRDALSPSQCASLLAGLLERRRDFESLDLVYDRDEVWTAHAFEWTDRFHIAMEKVTGAERRTKSTVESLVARNNARFRLLITDLAIRIFRGRHGRLPGGLAELAPEILPTTPIDPFTDGPLVYRLDGTDYVLYSVGQNKVDDGGVVVSDAGKTYVIAGQRRDAFLPGEGFDPERGDLFLDENDWVKESPID